MSPHRDFSAGKFPQHRQGGGGGGDVTPGGAASVWLMEGTGGWLLEDGVGYWLMEA